MPETNGGDLTPEQICNRMAAVAPRTPNPRSDTISAIINTTGRLFEVAPDVLLGPSRRRTHVEARHVAILLVRADTDLSWPEIGRLFTRDHSTVIQAAQRAVSSPLRLGWARAVRDEMYADVQVAT